MTVAGNESKANVNRIMTVTKERLTEGKANHIARAVVAGGRNACQNVRCPRLRLLPAAAGVLGGLSLYDSAAR